MGEVTIDTVSRQLLIHSIFYFYGDAASGDIAAKIARDIESYWNAPDASVKIRNTLYKVNFRIEAHHAPGLDPEKVWYNDDPRLNFFRIEDFASGNISFVDGLNSNTGYFLLSNVRDSATTAPHEYGHTIGLDHPQVLDIRGQSVPGIMYPRGTICDPSFQYDPNAKPGEKGGTLDPRHRQVLPSDVADLKLSRLSFNENGRAILGGFTSLYHEKHTSGFQQ